MSANDIRRGIGRLQKRVEEVYAFQPNAVRDPYDDPLLDRLSASVRETIGGVFGMNTPAYANFIRASEFSPGFKFLNRKPSRDEITEVFETCKRRSLGLLAAAITSLDERIENESYIDAEKIASASSSSKVFIVHGHDVAAKESLARFLEKIEIDAIILHEEPDRGRTIIEKFEECASQVGFAVVLLTPDDLGGQNAAQVQQARARQNVVFELGYFAAKLGRGRTCLMRKGDVEIPSDLFGVIYTNLDETEGWKLKLIKELKAAGIRFDANKVWG